VIEFLSDKELVSGQKFSAYAVTGRTDVIFVTILDENDINGLRTGRTQGGRPPNVYELNIKTKTARIMALEHLMELDILFEGLPVGVYKDYPGLALSADPKEDDLGLVAPIRKMGKEFVATLSSEQETTENTTFSIPNIIPFFGRSKWFQKEESHSGTFFLEIFDKDHPSKPVAELQKVFKDKWLLPSVFDVAAWAQGTKEPILVVVDNENPVKHRKARILLIRPQEKN